MNQRAVVSKFSHVKSGDPEFTCGAWATSSCIAISAYLEIVSPADFKAVGPAIEGAAGDALEVALPAVTGRINVCRRRLPRSVAVVLDVVRNMGLRPISSREHGSTGLDR